MRSSEKTISKLALKAALLLVVLVSTAFVLNFLTDPYYSSRHYGAIRDKIDAVSGIEGNKTVVIGGSSVLFGFNAEYYEALSGQKTVNFGLHAARSPDIYLNCVAPYLHSGDTAIIAFENSSFSNIDSWREYDDAGLDVAHLSGIYCKHLPIENLPQYYWQQFLRAYEKVALQIYSVAIKERIKGTETLYLRSNINQYGDLEPALFAQPQDIEAKPLHTSIDEGTLLLLKKYVDALEHEGVRVFIAFQPVLASEYSADEVKQQYAKFVEIFGEDRILGNPADWILNDPALFYDTQNHLTSVAASEHTKYLFETLTRMTE